MPKLPKGWSHSTLSNLVSEIVDNRGRSAPTSDFGIPLIATNCIKNDTLYPSYEKIRFVSEETYKTWFRNHLKPGDIIIVNKGSPGLVCLVPDPVDFCFAQDMVALRLNMEVVDGEYLFDALRSPYFLEQVNAYTVGTTVPHLKKEDFSKLLIPLPPRHLQEFIGRLYCDLSRKIECNRRINKTLEQMAMALYKHWFVDFGPFRNGEFVDSEIGPTPKGWEVGKLGETCHLLMGQSPPSKFYNELGEGLPFHQGVTNFGWRFPKHVTSCTGLARIADVGSILLSVRAPVGRINIANRRIVIGRGLASINHIRGWNSFLLYQLKSVFTKEDALGSGTIFNAVTRPDLEKIKVIIPPNNIIEEFDVTVSTYDKQILANEHESDILAHNRDYLLPKLISGEIQFKDADEFLNRRI